MSDQKAIEIYERSGLGRKSGFGKRPAVLVVDFCLGMTDPASPLGADMTNEVKATATLIQECRTKGLLVVYTTVQYAKGCKDGGAFIKKVPSLRIFEEGNGNWSEIDPRLERIPEEPVINKRFASAFFGTNLASLFTSEGVDTVIVTGSTTSGCVRASALDALQNGFMVIIPREAVADRAQAPHEANLFDLQAKYADVVSLEETLSYIREL
jgi:nicotinamidase-related amidase